MIVPLAPESNAPLRAKRIRLSKAPAATQPKSDQLRPKKVKLLSNRYTIPDNEFAQLTALKKHLLTLGVSAKKSELLRAGLALLVSLTDARLKKAVASVQLLNPKGSDAKDLA